jgi:hypothetical protein
MIELDRRRTAVYRFYDARDNLLYVGVAVNPKSRWYGHRDDKPWWPEVTTRTIEWFDDRRAAERAEFEAIQKERPRYNIHPTFWPKEPVAADPDEPGIEFVEWVRRTALAKGYRLGERGAMPALARAGDMDLNILKNFLAPKGPTQKWRRSPFVPYPPSVALLRGVAKAFGLPLDDVIIRAGLAEIDDFTRGKS